MRSRSMFPAVAVALAALVAAGAASGFENTIEVRVNPERQWQCGDNFYPTGGSDSYRTVQVFAGDRLLGSYDLALPSDCDKVLEYVVDLPDGGQAVTGIEVGGYRMDAPVTGRDRNRVWTVGFFVDSVSAELTADYVEPRATPAATLPADPPEGTYRNIIEIQVAPGRLWQCGDQFFLTGGSESYRYARLLVDGEEVGRYDFAAQPDCTRIVPVVRDMPDGGTARVTVEIGANVMGADINARERPRTWKVYFFVDQIWGEIYKDGE